MNILPHSTTTTDQQRSAVLARLCEALATVALCESYLALDAARRQQAVAHQRSADAANDRMLELGREARYE